MRKGLKGDPVADDVQVAFLAVGHDDTAEVKGHPALPRVGTVDSRPLVQVISPVAVSPTASPSSITRNSTASPRVGEGGIVNGCGSGWRVVRYLPVVGKGARGGQESLGDGSRPTTDCRMGRRSRSNDPPRAAR